MCSQVINIRPNMKVAVEVVDSRDLLLYALNTWVAGRWLGEGGANDYTGTNTIVLNALRECSGAHGW